MSGTGVADPESSSVSSPGICAAALALAQAKFRATSVGGNGAVGVSAKTKLCEPPEAMSTGVLGLPVTVFVFGSVVWKANPAVRLVSGMIVQFVAAPGPVLMIVANAIAGT